MARKLQSRISYTVCKRCGRSIATMSAYGRRRLMVNESHYEKYGQICSECMTSDERHEMTMERGADLADKFSTLKNEVIK